MTTTTTEAPMTDDIVIIRSPLKKKEQRPLVALVAGIAAITAGIAFGIYERIALLTSVGMTTDADESLAGLMGMHINQGEFPTFLWGQPYGGSLSTYFVAAAQRVFGVSLFSERLFSVCMGVAAALLVWRVATRYTSKLGAAVAGIAMWIWPIESIAWSMQEYLYYTPVLVAGLAAVLCAQRFAEQRKKLDVALFGFALGVGWWTSPLIIYFVLMASITLIPTFKAFFKRLPIALATFVIGALPWIIFNINHPLHSFDALVPKSGDFNDHLLTFFKDGLPVAIGIRSWSGGTLITPNEPNQMWAIGYAVAVLCALVAIWSFVQWRRKQTVFPADMAVMLIWPILASMSPYAPSSQLWIPRYFFLFWPFLAFAIGRIAGRKLGAIAVLAAMTYVSIFGLSYRPDEKPVWPDTKQLNAKLQEQHVDRFFGSYWIATRVTLDTQEKIIGAPPFVTAIRHQQYSDAVRNDDNPAWVYRKGDPPEAAFIDATEKLGVSTTVIPAGDYNIYLTERPVLPEELPFAAY